MTNTSAGAVFYPTNILVDNILDDFISADGFLTDKYLAGNIIADS